MILSHTFAQEIANKVSPLIGHNVNIFNMEGIIIGSLDSERIDGFHQGALEAIKTGREVTITDEKSSKLKGVKPGVNLPLEFNGSTIGAVGITGSPDKVRTLTYLTKMTVETMIKMAFMEKEAQLDSKAKEHILYNIIFEQIDETRETLKQRAALLGFDIDIPRVAVVLHLDGYENCKIANAEKDKVLDCIKYVMAGNKHYLSAYTGSNEFVVFLPVNPSDEKSSLKKYISRTCKSIANTIKNYLNLDCTIGVSSLCSETVLSYKKSYRDAADSLAIGKKFKGHGGVYFTDDLGLELILNCVPSDTADKFIKNTLGEKKKAITGILDETLLYTLKVFFDCNLNISETARALFIHRNTLLYRLDKIYKLTKRDPRIFDEAIELKILFLLNKTLLKQEEAVVKLAQ
ncbi:MAG: transcriptional regulator, CdaR [Peptococcaceae bacterium]|jgi:carbohydrate diacid regulator|nr:transcriptional regulator, CdaR [Peptococcaceae bacterium]